METPEEVSSAESAYEDAHLSTSSASESEEEPTDTVRKKHRKITARFDGPQTIAECRATGHYDLTTEDSCYVLRELEKDAFQTICNAFRAQGPLTPYKELILDHLRYALFINEHDFIRVIQETTDNIFLRNVCRKLNPSASSCSVQWKSLAFSSHPPQNPFMNDVSHIAKNRASLMTTIGCHNVAVKDLDIAATKLANLKKERFVPQQLRRVLIDSELSSGRFSVENPDITEEILEREFEDYEVEKRRIAAENAADIRNRVGRTRRGKKRGIPIPSFADHTLRAQARAARPKEPKEVDPSFEKLPTEEEQGQAEAEMFKFLENQEKARREARMKLLYPHLVPPLASEPAEEVEISPPKSILKIKKDFKKTPKEVPVIKVKSPTAIRSPPIVSSSPAVEPMATPSFTPPVIRVSTPAPPPQKVAHFEIIHPPPKANRAEEQRAMDEDLVLVKTAQAMIEDLENTMEPENGLTPGKRKRPKHDITPKRRGRKPIESKDNPITCARTTPFVFEGRGNDPNKPPRGNPDKKIKTKPNEVYKAPPIVTNGVQPDKPAISPPASQPRLPNAVAPKTAIIPVTPATIVIRPRHPSLMNTPSATPVHANDGSPAKRMRFSSEGTTPSASASEVPRVFPVIRQSGRPTLFRPPNVVFPRSANALSNGSSRLPFTTQASGNPTRPYYGNPTFSTRGPRDRPTLHTFRPPTAVIRLVTTNTEIKTDDKPRASDEHPVSKKEKDNTTNGTTAKDVPSTSLNSDTAVSQSGSTSTHPSTSTNTTTPTSMISIRPTTFSNLPKPTMINLQAVTISSKPTSQIYQVVNAPASQVYMQTNQIVQTAVPIVLHTVTSSNLTQPSILNVPLKSPVSVVTVKQQGLPSNIEENKDGNVKEIFPTEEGGERSISASDEGPSTPPATENAVTLVSAETPVITKPIAASSPEPPFSQPEVVVNGVDPHISSTVQTMVNNHTYQQIFSPPPPSTTPSRSSLPAPSQTDDPMENISSEAFVDEGPAATEAPTTST